MSSSIFTYTITANKARPRANIWMHLLVYFDSYNFPGQLATDNWVQSNLHWKMQAKNTWPVLDLVPSGDTVQHHTTSKYLTTTECSRLDFNHKSNLFKALKCTCGPRTLAMINEAWLSNMPSFFPMHILLFITLTHVYVYADPEGKQNRYWSQSCRLSRTGNACDWHFNPILFWKMIPQRNKFLLQEQVSNGRNSCPPISVQRHRQQERHPEKSKANPLVTSKSRQNWCFGCLDQAAINWQQGTLFLSGSLKQIQTNG